MHQMSLAASVLLLILFGNSQFLDPGTNSDSSMELFPSDNFIDDLPEASSNVNDLPYSGFIAGTSGCPSTSSNDLSNNDLSNNDLSNNDLSNYDLSRVRARNAVCPVLQDGGTPPSTTEDQGKVINQLLAPLDAKDFTGETELKNFVNWFCPDYTPMERAIPVCSSGAEDDIYLNAFGGLTLRNCELVSLANMHACISPKYFACCKEFEVVMPGLLILPGGPFPLDTYSWGVDCVDVTGFEHP